jgi:hypothetical protein
MLMHSRFGPHHFEIAMKQHLEAEFELCSVSKAKNLMLQLDARERAFG